MTAVRASADERTRLHERFAALCRIRSVFGEERAIADEVAAELRSLGLDVHEDDSAAGSGAGAGNLLVRLPGRAARTVLFCAHLDTVPHDGVVEPVLEDEAWVSAGETILGADNKAAVAMLMVLARRYAQEPAPVGLEILLTTSEENALAGAKAFDVRTLRATEGYVFDHASPIGEIVVASPTYYRLEAAFRGKPAHAGIRPEDGRSAILAAARAIVALPHGRIDAQSTANVGGIRGGTAGTNIVAEHCSFLAEARSLDPAKAEALVATMVDAVHDAANDPVCSCDVDLTVAKLFDGYRHPAGAPTVLAAEVALERCGYTARRIVTGGGTDGNAFEAAGLRCTNLANGTEDNHENTERVSARALEGMLDVTLTLLDVLAEGASA
ncbi:MAG: M20/M25/M40 family metallo-hydrolase [Solirubrobacterales bacterium]|nr:M20/M25/M40 family metallo-hydrolase [Solirubrobacterales bacterium]